VYSRHRSTCSSANALPAKPDIIATEIIRNLKFMLVVSTTPIKGNLRISFYQVKFMLACGSGRKNSGACPLNLERG
jgi:hypothetical protein